MMTNLKAQKTDIVAEINKYDKQEDRKNIKQTEQLSSSPVLLLNCTSS